MSRKNIHLIFKTHLDIGFTDYAARVRNQYHAHFLPMAIETGEHLWQENSTASKFIWTTGAWLIHEHLETGTAEQRRKLENAIDKGIVTWHALPYTTHTELLSANLFRAGLGYCQDLDRWFDRKTTGAKMTDVPGHTLGMVPLLAEAGIRFLHIGVNSASTPPAVPPIFRWRAAGGEEIVVLYQSDYGSTCFPNGMNDGIAFAHTMDNMGPQGISQVVESHRLMAEDYPDADIKASSLSAFGDAAWKQREQFPVVASEIADSWIHGVGSAPAKVSKFMALRRLYDDWASAGLTQRQQAFGRRLVMVAEHTWGVDIKTFLRDETAWDRTEFDKTRSSDSRFQLTEKSWQEQEDLIEDAIHAVDQADRSQAKKLISSGSAAPLTGTVSKQMSMRLDNGELFFNQANGGLNSIRFPNGQTLSSANGMFAVLSYESYDAEDYAQYMDSYLTHSFDWALRDHGKPGLENATTARSEVFVPEWLGAIGDHHNSIIAKFRYASVAVDELGAPAAPEIRYNFTDDDTLRISVHYFGKPANRMPEASFLTFAADLDCDSWRFRKMGYLIDPKRVMDDGNKQLHAVESIEATQSGNAALTITPLDSPLAGPAETPFLPFYRGPVSMQAGIRFNLHNNKWGTNFPMWYGGSPAFRFEIRLRKA